MDKVNFPPTSRRQCEVVADTAQPLDLSDHTYYPHDFSNKTRPQSSLSKIFGLPKRAPVLRNAALRRLKRGPTTADGWGTIYIWCFSDTPHEMKIGRTALAISEGVQIPKRIRQQRTGYSNESEQKVVFSRYVAAHKAIEDAIKKQLARYRFDNTQGTRPHGYTEWYDNNPTVILENVATVLEKGVEMNWATVDDSEETEKSGIAVGLYLDHRCHAFYTYGSRRMQQCKNKQLRGLLNCKMHPNHADEFLLTCADRFHQAGKYRDHRVV